MVAPSALKSDVGRTILTPSVTLGKGTPVEKVIPIPMWSQVISRPETPMTSFHTGALTPFGVPASKLAVIVNVLTSKVNEPETGTEVVPDVKVPLAVAEMTILDPDNPTLNRKLSKERPDDDVPPASEPPLAKTAEMFQCVASVKFTATGIDPDDRPKPSTTMSGKV